MKKILFATVTFFALSLVLAFPAVWAQQGKSGAEQGAKDAPGSIQTPADYSQMSGGDPFAELEQMQMRMMEMLRGVMASDFFKPGASGLAGQTIAPDYDMYETKNAYIVNIDAPGMQKEKIDVQAREGMLNITAERERSEERMEEKEGGSYYYKGRSFGTFQRSLKIPENVKLDEISARYENGVLEVTLPKSAEQAPEARKIPVA